MIGQTVGNYRILRPVGQGGMGRVFAAHDEMLDREVAIKVLRPEAGRTAELLERFRTEAVALARLAHPNIATIFGLQREADNLFMIMELLKGETLEQRLRRGAFGWREGIGIMTQLLAALEYAHANGVIHRDLKPANVMLCAGGAVKVMDFGVARVLGTARQTRVGTVVGTIAYMAPEQVRGEEGDARTDVYAAGMLCYELLTGHAAFAADSEWELMRAVLERPAPDPRALAPGVPDWLAAVVGRALAKAAADRFDSAASFGTELARDAREHGVAVPAPATRLGEAPVPGTRVAGSPEMRPTRLADGGTQAPTAHAGRMTALRAPLIAAAVVVLIAATGAWWWRSNLLCCAPRDSVVAGGEPAQPPSAALSMQPGLPQGPSQIQVPVNTVPPPVPREPAPRPVAPRPQPPVAGLLARTPDPVPVTTPRDEPGAEPAGAARTDDPAPDAYPRVSFDRVRCLVKSGDKVKEFEATLTFDGGELVISTPKAVPATHAVRVRRIESAVYSSSKRPRWKEGAAAAVAFGVFATPVFFMKSTSHWLTIDAGGEPVVLRLDKRNFEAIITALESRWGRRVERAPAEND